MGGTEACVVGSQDIMLNVGARARVMIIRIGNCLPTLKGLASLNKLYNLITDALGSS